MFPKESVIVLNTVLSGAALTCDHLSHRRSAAARPLCDDLGCVLKVHLITFRHGCSHNVANEHFRMPDRMRGTPS
jgi:hypothetical protein